MKTSTLDRLSAICFELPEAQCERRGDHASFMVRKKIFAYYLSNHHGDGIVSICAKVLPGDNGSLIAADPSKFYSPAYIGPRGWVGLRLDVGKIDWEEVSELVTGSYILTAPKPLAAAVESKLGEPAIGKQLRPDNIRRVVRDKK
ncbi:MAG TPA: MmcQ/YjbR family DNA-binding protein [Bryobacteraceae bacterium]|nr:MmcQ/YjbR family DNA-binding protein [Bryobacteraceae bacterium]